MNALIFRFIVISLIFLCCNPAEASEISIVTEDFPPYSYLRDGKITGVSTEVVRAVLKEVGTDAEIKIYPWARAYRSALNEKNVLIYSIGRTKERENLFKWVGIVAPCDIYLFKLKERKEIKADSLDTAKHYVLGILRQDMCLDYLKSKGFDNITVSDTDEDSIKILVRKRVDLIPFAELSFVFSVRKLGYDPSDFEKVCFIKDLSEGLYMAFSKETPDILVERFKNALDKVKADGTYNRIMNAYSLK